MLFRYLNLYKTAGFLPVFFLPIQASDNVLHVGENDTCLKISLSPGRQWGMIFSVQKITCKHVYHISKYFPKKVLNIEYLGNWSKLYYMLGTHHNKSRLLSLPIAPSPFPDIHGIFHSPPPLLLTVAPLSSWGDPWYLL